MLHDAAPDFLRVDLGFDVPFSDDEDIDFAIVVGVRIADSR